MRYRLLETLVGREVVEEFDAPSDDEARERVLEIAEGHFELSREGQLVLAKSKTDAPQGEYS